MSAPTLRPTRRDFTAAAIVALADAADACLTEAGTPAHASFAQPPPRR